jgi:hypothetical protein
VCRLTQRAEYLTALERCFRLPMREPSKQLNWSLFNANS